MCGVHHTGVKNVPTFDAALLLVMYTPIVTLVWVASQSIAWLPTLCLVLAPLSQGGAPALRGPR